MPAKYTLLELDKNIEVLLVEEAFDKKEYDEIWDETLKFAKSPNLSTDRQMTGVATTPDGKPIAYNKYGFFIDTLYQNRMDSPYLRNYKKFIYELQTHSELKKSLTWNAAFQTTSDTTLFAKYTKDGNYNGHYDSSVVTQLFWMCGSPKKFTGGDLIFDDFNVTVEFKTNTALIFPGWLKHTITPVVSKKALKDKECRYSYASFYGFGGFMQ